MLDQGSEVVIIFLGHTLRPTKFTTFKEELLSFFGFSLCIPGQILFMLFGNQSQRRFTDVEPFQMSGAEDRTETEVADNRM
jgi:hypothetical protein